MLGSILFFSFKKLISLSLVEVKALRVRCADKVSLHVVDLVVGVHQVLLVFALDLDRAHHHAIESIHHRLIVILAASLLGHRGVQEVVLLGLVLLLGWQIFSFGRRLLVTVALV